MILSVFYKAIGAQFANITKSAGFTFTDYNGTNQTAYSKKPSNYVAFSTYMSTVRTVIPSNTYGVVFGTGTTPVSDDDYTISGDIVSKISSTNVINGSGDESGIRVSCLYTLTNTGTTDITIGEVALFMDIPYSSNYSSGTMIERTVLDEPITIPAGGVGQVTYTIRMNYPT